MGNTLVSLSTPLKLLTIPDVFSDDALNLAINNWPRRANLAIKLESVLGVY